MSLKINLEAYFPPIPHTMEIYTFCFYIHYSSKWHSRLNSFSNVDAWCEACEFSDEDKVIWVLKYGKYLPERIEELGLNPKGIISL